VNKLFLMLLFALSMNAWSQNPQWDDTNKQNWPEPFKQIEIPCSIDNEMQKAYVHFSNSKTPKPLIVSLHTWSGDYTQKDPLVSQIVKNDWHYIHPDFRGPNNTQKACGSLFVISDIDDAISYALSNANVDPEQIHVIGASGGGFASMLMYMKSKHNVRTFSSWVGISDLEKWYYESLGRKNKYAQHIALATTGDTLGIDIKEARFRSPVYMETPVRKRKNAKLFLYCGIHDGYNGSVPITHTIDFYNKVVADFDSKQSDARVPVEIREKLLRQRCLPEMNFLKCSKTE
jgi:hypothetical protein